MFILRVLAPAAPRRADFGFFAVWRAMTLGTPPNRSDTLFVMVSRFFNFLLAISIYGRDTKPRDAGHRASA